MKVGKKSLKVSSSVLTGKYKGKRWEDDEDRENCIGKGN